MLTYEEKLEILGLTNLPPFYSDIHDDLEVEELIEEI